MLITTSRTCEESSDEVAVRWCDHTSSLSLRILSVDRADKLYISLPDKKTV